MTAPQLRWPVYGHDPRETIATFLEYGDAASFVSANSHSGTGEPTGFERRNLYIGQPKRVTPYVRMVRDTCPETGNERVAA